MLGTFSEDLPPSGHRDERAEVPPLRSRDPAPPFRASSGSRKQKRALLAPRLGGLGGSAGLGRRWRKRSEWAFPGRRRRQGWAPSGDCEHLRPPSGPRRRSSLCWLARTDHAGACEEGWRDGPGPCNLLEVGPSG